MEKSKFNQYVELLSVFYQNDFKTMIMGVQNRNLSDQKERFHTAGRKPESHGASEAGKSSP